MVLNWDNEWTIVKREIVLVQLDETQFVEKIGMKNRLLTYYFDEYMKPITYPVDAILPKEFHSWKTR